MTTRAAWLLPVGQTREDTRITPNGTMTPTGELTTRPGVIAGGKPFAATGAGTMQVQIGTGRAVVQGTTAQGAYPVAVTSPETLTVGDGAAQHPRLDTVVLKVYDGLYDISGTTLAAVEILRGEPAAAPVPLPLPPACLPLWDIRVPAGTSAGTGGINWTTALTDRRQYAASYAGITPGGGTYPGAYPGQYRDNAGTLERWDGTAWRVYRPPLNVEATTAGASAGTGFALLSFNGRRVGGVCSVTAEFNRTGATINVPTGGNITDVQLGTIPAGWTPAVAIEGAASDGIGDGGVYVNPSGGILLRTWSSGGSIATGRSIRVAACFVQ
ncbi:hypothetical protein [Streptomyces sp. NPDC051561]|uniref:hypothetical protein n=1 Tax=Streptomyces sp. NPDC051561 TaxID=3365658 RepID=UPI0037B8B994